MTDECRDRSRCLHLVASSGRSAVTPSTEWTRLDGAFGELVGQSPALEAVARQIDLVAPTDSAVLILGESGTGKELVAREIHRRSQRASKALIKVNCAAVPRELYESEFFGHARGAFTGALRDRAW
jgi:transcriptional regulator with GAF, ATPase, and Fis domain